MAAESGIGAVKEKIRALREDKGQVEESGKREILRQKIRRLKRRTRKLSREARLQEQNAAAAPAEVAPAAAPAAPEGSGPGGSGPGGSGPGSSGPGSSGPGSSGPGGSGPGSSGPGSSGPGSSGPGSSGSGSSGSGSTGARSSGKGAGRFIALRLGSHPPPRLSSGGGGLSSRGIHTRRRSPVTMSHDDDETRGCRFQTTFPLPVVAQMRLQPRRRIASCPRRALRRAGRRFGLFRAAEDSSGRHTTHGCRHGNGRVSACSLPDPYRISRRHRISALARGAGDSRTLRIASRPLLGHGSEPEAYRKAPTAA